MLAKGGASRDVQSQHDAGVAIDAGKCALLPVGGWRGPRRARDGPSVTFSKLNAEVRGNDLRGTAGGELLHAKGADLGCT